MALATGSSYAADPILVGYVGDLSGACGPYSDTNLKATTIAVDEINAAGGLLGRKVELKVRDSKTNPEEATKQSREAFVVDKVDLLTGSCSSAVMLADAAVAKEYKKLFWNSIGTTHRANIDFANEYVYQSLANAVMEGRALAEYAATQKSWKKIATIGLDYEWPRMTIDSFVKRLKELRPDVQVTNSVWPKLGESNFSSYIPVLLNDNPDVVFGVMFGSASTNFIRQGKTYGMFDRTKVFTYASTYLMMALGNDVPEGVYGWTRSPFYAKSPAMNAFVAKYQAAHKDFPYDEAIAGYDTMIQMGEAIKRANSLEPAKLVDALSSMEFSGVRGPVKVRKLDITAYAPTYIGVTKKTQDYAFPILTDLVRIGGETVMPTEAEVASMRAAAK
jgi:branched-chain amino acid transport system substrate-binding protein